MPENSPDEEYARPVKRIRQACENCRRKKTRCPGEQPTCSLCARLKQRCVYAEDHPRAQSSVPEVLSSGVDENSRLQAIEQRLLQLESSAKTQHDHERGQDRLQDLPADRSNSAKAARLKGNAAYHSLDNGGTDPTCSPSFQGSELQLPQELIEAGLKHYHEHFSHQPYPLFSRPELQDWANSGRPPDIVLHPMLALSIHTMNDPEHSEYLYIMQPLCETAWRHLVDAYSSFSFDEAYFQGLCLMVQLDFADGNVHRAQTQLALGLRLAQLTDFLPADFRTKLDDGTLYRRLEIIWTLLMLERLLTGPTKLLQAIHASAFGLCFGQIPHDRPDHFSAPNSMYALSAQFGWGDEHGSAAIVAVNAELSDIWHDVMQDVAAVSKEDNVPFWRGTSRRGQIMSRLLDLETRSAHHSYTASGPLTRVLQEPHLKSYFSARLFYALMHSTTYCVVNHPFIIYLKTRQLRSGVPLTFLQKCYRTATLYADWIERLMCEAKEAGISMHDPFVAYMISIAATIHLENSFRPDRAAAAASNSKFKTLLDFVEKQTNIWINAKRLYIKLQQIQARIQNRQILHYVEDDYDSAQPRNGMRNVILAESDVAMMWELFDYATITKSPEDESYTPSRPDADHSSAADEGMRSCESHVGPTVPFTVDNAAMSVDFASWPLDHMDLPNSMTAEWSLFGEPWSTYYPFPTGSMPP